jgi:hypothetical protein
MAVGLWALTAATGLAQESWTPEAAASERAAAGTRAAEAGYLPRLSWMEFYTRSNNPVYVFGPLQN